MRNLIAAVLLLGCGAVQAAPATDLECDKCVQTNEIAAGAITTGRLNKSAVTTGKIRSRAVTTGKIKDGAVTVEKVAPEIANSFDSYCPLGEGVYGKDSNGNYVCEAPGGYYAIGDIGPAGGWVFYVTTDGLHGLEAAPADVGTAQWGCPAAAPIGGATGTALGTGARNTDDIIRGCADVGIAADLAGTYISPGGYIDWFLPSKDELNLIRQNLGPDTDPLNMAGLKIDGVNCDYPSEVCFYWSSSETYNGFGYGAWFHQMEYNTPQETAKTDVFNVRPVRAF
jgi:hypothetical protein